MAKTSPQTQELQGSRRTDLTAKDLEKKKQSEGEEEETAAEGVTKADDLREHLADLNGADRLHRVADEPHLALSPSAFRRRNHESRTGREVEEEEAQRQRARGVLRSCFFFRTGPRRSSILWY